MRKHTLRIYYNKDLRAYFNYKKHKFYIDEILCNGNTIYLDYGIGECTNTNFIYEIEDYITFYN